MKPASDNTLDIRGAVLGDGLLMRETEGGSVTLHTLDSGGARLFGSFANAAEAWRALDELDAPEALDEAA